MDASRSQVAVQQTVPAPPRLGDLRGTDIFSLLRAHHEELDEYFWQYYMNYTTDRLVQYIKDLSAVARPSGRVLSIGCGHGLNEVLMADMCEDVETILGVDILTSKIASLNVIASLLRSNRVVGVVGDGTALPAADEGFDGVLLIESLSHIPDAGAVLREALRVLKRGGWIFVFDANNAANPLIWVRHRRERQFEYEIPVNPYALRNRLRSLGAVKVALSPYVYTPFFRRIGGRFTLRPESLPSSMRLLVTAGFMLRAEKG